MGDELEATPRCRQEAGQAVEFSLPPLCCSSEGQESSVFPAGAWDYDNRTCFPGLLGDEMGQGIAMAGRGWCPHPLVPPEGRCSHGPLTGHHLSPPVSGGAVPGHALPQAAWGETWANGCPVLASVSSVVGGDTDVPHGCSEVNFSPRASTPTVIRAPPSIPPALQESQGRRLVWVPPKGSPSGTFVGAWRQPTSTHPRAQEAWVVWRVPPGVGEPEKASVPLL